MGATISLNLRKLSEAVQRVRQQSAPGTIPSRRNFLRKSALLGAVGGGLVLLDGVHNKTNAASTKTYELTQAELGEYFRQIQAHENAHVAFITDALGKNARPTPSFQGLEQSSLADFLATSQALENTGVGAYLGASPYILKQKNVSSATAISLIEGRHAGFINGVRNYPVTGQATALTSNPSFDTPLTIDQVTTAAGPFISDLNGGPALTFSTTKSGANDTRILNFALALEQLEAAYYNINVPKFFGND